MVQECPNRKTYFHVTGFGKFGGVPENPTTFLVNALPETLKGLESQGVYLASNQIVDVHINACD